MNDIDKKFRHMIHVDPHTQQYGNYMFVEGHNLSPEEIETANRSIQEDIDHVFNGVAMPKIKRWSYEEWMLDNENGPTFWGHDIGGCIPVTLFVWKSRPINKK